MRLQYPVSEARLEDMCTFLSSQTAKHVPSPLKKAQETSDIPSVDYCENNSTYVLVEDLLASKHKALVDRTRRQILGYSFI